MPTVRLIDEDKEMLGVFSRDDALRKAEEAGLDLVRSGSARKLRLSDRASRGAACVRSRARACYVCDHR